ncbi:hypothetical protein PIB30_102609 [Stylosanthes scabra]|uniref:LSM domain-containing protein n=1 Tax=Stylosanthes scabra TaxID=79078 RepID=A0ABU6TZY0_9FABA|nr:hypothetical protein [Stylosanthes scabra]
MEEEGRESVGVGDGSSSAVTRARKLVFRRMLVGIKDGRFFLGGFYCIDKQGNIILQDAVEYRPTRRSSSSPSPSPLEQRCLGLILIPASCRATCHKFMFKMLRKMWNMVDQIPITVSCSINNKIWYHSLTTHPFLLHLCRRLPPPAAKLSPATLFSFSALPAAGVFLSPPPRSSLPVALLLLPSLQLRL